MSTDRKIISINKALGRQSVKEVLDEIWEKSDQYGCILVIAERKREFIDKGEEPYDLECSDMTIADANYLLDAAKFMLFHSED